MPKFYLMTIFLTRKCSLRCPHCEIYKTHKKEIPPEEWKSIIEEWHSVYPEMHFSFIGGEPLEYWEGKGLEKLIPLLASIEADFSFTSNSLALTKQRLRLYKDLGLKNWTVSIDYPLETAKKIGDLRAVKGFQVIEWGKELNLPDLHVTITIYPENARFFPKLVQELMDLGVWIEPTFAMWNKALHYDSFPAEIKPIWTEKDKEYIKEGFEMLKNYEKFHGVPEMFTFHLDVMLRAEFRCDNLYVPTLDEDGFMRLCRDIKGEYIPRWHGIRAINYLEDFIEAWNFEREKLCLGCNWDCIFQSYIGFRSFIHPKKNEK